MQDEISGEELRPGMELWHFFLHLPGAAVCTIKIVKFAVLTPFLMRLILPVKVHHLWSIMFLLFSIQGSAQQSQKQPYNDAQDFRSELQAALTDSGRDNKHVLVQFGGNWCPWCIRFHALAAGDRTIDSLMRAQFIYLLANVPKEKDKRDYDLFRQYGYPNRFGFPVFVILDSAGNRLNTQDSDAFEHPDPGVKGYDTAKVVRFLKMWSPTALDPATYKTR